MDTKYFVLIQLVLLVFACGLIAPAAFLYTGPMMPLLGGVFAVAAIIVGIIASGLKAQKSNPPENQR